jgi:hypothetical protein
LIVFCRRRDQTPCSPSLASPVSGLRCLESPRLRSPHERQLNACVHSGLFQPRKGHADQHLCSVPQCLLRSSALARHPMPGIENRILNSCSAGAGFWLHAHQVGLAGICGYRYGAYLALHSPLARRHQRFSVSHCCRWRGSCSVVASSQRDSGPRSDGCRSSTGSQRLVAASLYHPAVRPQPVKVKRLLLERCICI